MSLAMHFRTIPNRLRQLRVKRLFIAGNSYRKLEFRLSALMDSDVAWVNGKSGRLSSCYTLALSSAIGSHLPFLPARRYASAGYRDRNVSVCLSVRASVRHAPVLCQNEEC